MQRVETARVVIVGAGLGALYAALNLSPRPVVLISPEALGEGASSAWAQGGVAAAMDPADSAKSHAADTVNAGAGIVDAAVADRVAREARQHILDLTDLGAPFDLGADGAYVLSREAAHSFARVVRVKGDQAGAEIMRALVAQVRQTPSIQVVEGVLATGLEVSDGQVTGVRLERDGGSEPRVLAGSAVLLAGGGSGGLYKLTTNPRRIRGQVIGMAARAGAVIADPEFVQFHPTAIDTGEDPAPLATEALRGEGAVLINCRKARFMSGVHVDAELAPRDVVARAVFSQTQRGLRPALDTTEVLGDRIDTLFPGVAKACRRGGIDPATAPIPVAAAAHYHMGGIATDARGRASLSGLWVCGEAASTGLHGANRLASNGLLEALVYARTCALDIAGRTKANEAAPVALRFEDTVQAPDETAVQTLRQLMTDHVGVVRDGAGLRQALAGIARLEANHPTDETFRNMCATATLIAAAALQREESRGAHFRTDFPDAAPRATRTRITLSEAIALRDAASQEEPA